MESLGLIVGEPSYSSPVCFILFFNLTSEQNTGFKMNTLDLIL